MKHVVIGLTLAALAAASSVSQAQEAGAPAGNVEKASIFANGNLATILAVGLGATTALVVAVVGVSDDGNGNGNGSTSTATATATTR